MPRERLSVFLLRRRQRSCPMRTDHPAPPFSSRVLDPMGQLNVIGFNTKRSFQSVRIGNERVAFSSA